MAAPWTSLPLCIALYTGGIGLRMASKAGEERWVEVSQEMLGHGRRALSRLEGGFRRKLNRANNSGLDRERTRNR